MRGYIRPAKFSYYTTPKQTDRSHGFSRCAFLKSSPWHTWWVGEADRRAQSAATSASAGDTQAPAPDAEAVEHEDKVFEEFDPLALMQHADKTALRFETFDASLDAFFAKVGSRVLNSGLQTLIIDLCIEEIPGGHDLPGPLVGIIGVEIEE